MIKLIMSDMDGTLLDDAGNLPAEFPAMMNMLEKRGVMFAPASGRQYFSLLESFADYKKDMVFIAENGTVIMHNGKELFSSVIDRELTLEILQAGAKLPGIYSVFCGKKDAYILKSQKDTVIKAELAKYYTHNGLTADFAQVDDEAIKMSFYDPTGHAKENIYNKLEKYSDKLQVTRSSDYWVDIMNLDINKGVAIAKIQERLGLKPEECAAFGDYLNDVEMMQAVYYSYAMENAHDKIKKLARFNTASNNDAGVIKGIQQMAADGLI